MKRLAIISDERIAELRAKWENPKLANWPATTEQKHELLAILRQRDFHAIDAEGMRHRIRELEHELTGATDRLAVAQTYNDGMAEQLAAANALQADYQRAFENANDACGRLRRELDALRARVCIPCAARGVVMGPCPACGGT